MDTQFLTADVWRGALNRARDWFRREGRAYPWTQTHDPYAVWISEIMLQQTVVTAVVAPYQAWMSRWPTVNDLAQADETEVLRAWEGLGYASRAKNLVKAARQIVSDNGQFPSDVAELRRLAGIGEYTAAAIASFAFGQPTLTLDANLKRVFQRLDAAPEWTAEGESRWRRLWAECVDGPSSRESNQAIMQLGQLVCRPTPVCGACPLSSDCRAFHEGTANVIPAKKARVVIDKVTQVVFWTRQGEHWWLARPDRGRFSNLWLVPPSTPPHTAQPLGTLVHTYTKYRDRVTAWRAEGPAERLPAGWNGQWFERSALDGVPMVRAYRILLERALNVDEVPPAPTLG